MYACSETMKKLNSKIKEYLYIFGSDSLHRVFNL